jgi:hypothetical protein
MTHLKRFLPLLLMLALLPACGGGNGVKLTYALGPTLSSCEGNVVVFKFKDERPGTRLGKDNGGRVIDTLSDVSDWVGWALFDELEAAGCTAKYRTSTMPTGDETVVTGEILDVGLDQTGTTTYRGKAAVRVVVSRSGKTVHSEKFASEVEDVVLPGYGSKSDLMAEVLRTLMAEIVPVVCKNL